MSHIAQLKRAVGGENRLLAALPDAEYQRLLPLQLMHTARTYIGRL